MPVLLIVHPIIWDLSYIELMPGIERTPRHDDITRSLQARRHRCFDVAGPRRRIAPPSDDVRFRIDAALQ